MRAIVDRERILRREGYWLRSERKRVREDERAIMQISAAAVSVRGAHIKRAAAELLEPPAICGGLADHAAVESQRRAGRHIEHARDLIAVRLIAAAGRAEDDVIR